MVHPRSAKNKCSVLKTEHYYNTPSSVSIGTSQHPQSENPLRAAQKGLGLLVSPFSTFTTFYCPRMPPCASPYICMFYASSAQQHP